MRKSDCRLLPALAIGLGAAFPSLSLAAEPATTKDDPPRLAFSLDEMNCMSSDVQARSVTPDGGLDVTGAMQIADESGGGTNGIPCPRRDPKSTPAQRNQG